jgi:energy-coupling factor transporter transmembrane protein EcfT
VSKWFCYALIAIFLIILISFLSYAVLLGNEMALRFLPTVLGLAFTFFIFIVFFDLREKLEWKSVENKVKKSIGSQLLRIFGELLYLCGLEEHYLSLDDRLLMNYKNRLEQLSTSKVELDSIAEELSKNKELANDYATFFESRIHLLRDTEDRYWKFLSPEFHTSLMEIQGGLWELWRALSIIPLMKHFRERREARYESLSNSVAKVAKGIAKIRESGLDIGF